MEQTRDIHLGRFEATSECYGRCVDEGGCVAAEVIYLADWNPDVPEIHPAPDYWRDPFYADFPVGQLTFRGAQDYCAFLGGRLPTSAEWEHAARGNEGLVFPWQGAADPTDPTSNEIARGARQCERWSCERDVVRPVASFPLGAGPYGHFDIAGNAAEWVADTASPYEGPFDEPLADPFTDDGGSRRAVRGWPTATFEWFAMDASGEYDMPLFRYSGTLVGVRCAFDTQPAPLLAHE